MKNIHVTKEPVTLEGYQAILKPSKFGYSLKAVVGSDIVDALETSLLLSSLGLKIRNHLL